MVLHEILCSIFLYLFHLQNLRNASAVSAYIRTCILPCNMRACSCLLIFFVAFCISGASACCKDKMDIDACVYDNVDCDCQFVSDGSKCVCRETISDVTDHYETCDLRKTSESQSSNNEAFILSLVSLTICIGLALFVLIWVCNYRPSPKCFGANHGSSSGSETRALLRPQFSPPVAANMCAEASSVPVYYEPVLQPGCNGPATQFVRFCTQPQEVQPRYIDRNRRVQG
jgi:hypothetical protein